MTNQTPYDDRHECWLAGAMLIGQTHDGQLAIDDLGDFDPANMLVEQYRVIVRSAIRLRDAGSPVDCSTIIEDLEHSNGFVPAWPSTTEALQVFKQLMEGCYPTWHIANWCRRIEDDSRRRKMAALTVQLSRELALPVPDSEKLENLSDQISSLARSGPAKQTTTKVTTLRDAARGYLDGLKSGSTQLIETGIGDLDNALSGGVEFGEMVLLAARPSHGKSAVGLQMLHHWTSQGIPCAFISEEMSANSIGKRAVQFATAEHQEHWRAKSGIVQQDLDIHFSDRSECHIVESCRTAAAACNSIRRLHRDHGVRCVVVDYAQLLGSPGKTRYEQVTATSIALRQVTNETGILLVALCQLNRSLETRVPMIPHPSDLKDSGQLEQDADVIIFQVWPHRVDSSHDPKLYQFFVGKNRNRAINAPAIVCRFEASRQRILDGAIHHSDRETQPDYSRGWR